MIISVDGGETTGVAIFSGPTPAVTSIKNLTPAEADALLGWCQDAAASVGETLTLVVEDQYAKIRMVRIRGKLVATIDLPALLKLARSAEIWVVLARLRGIDAKRVMPATWQGKMLKSARLTKGAKKTGATKRSATEVFAGTWPEVYRFKGLPRTDDPTRIKAARVNEHIRDAALMGRWYQLFG